MTPDEVVQCGLKFHIAGQLSEAECEYAKALAVNPNHPDALRLTARIAATHGDNNRALQNLIRAATVAPMAAELHTDLSIILRRLGQIDASISASRRAIQLQPNNFEAFNNLANCLRDQGDLAAAASGYQHALTIDPNSSDCHHNLGNTLAAQGFRLQAVEQLQRAIQLNPHDSSIHNDLGSVWLSMGDLINALQEFSCSVSLDPHYLLARNNLVVALKDLGRLDDALMACEETLSFAPQSAENYNNYGSVLDELGKTDESIAAFKRALEINPRLDHVFNNLGHVLKSQSRLTEALDAFRHALRLEPRAIEAHDNLLFLLQFLPLIGEVEADKERKRWLDQCIHPIRDHCRWYTPDTGWTHDNEPAPTRRIRIGYVSGDFMSHSVGRFIAPIVLHHDRNQFEIHCFSNVLRGDDATDWFRESADHWHNIKPLTDAAAADLILSEKIDILVDLSLHTAGNRLLVFAYKPAPVQVTHLAYCGTSGMDTIDYVMADPYLVPPDLDSAFTEQPFRLPSTFWCYAPMPSSPDVNPPPVLSLGNITFGCLNNFAKVSSEAFRVWCDLLKAIPNSKLILHCRDGSHRQRLRDQMEEDGINPDRLIFVGFIPFDRYLQQYHFIDIALDSFPVAGGTTTCDALWMGVPVVSFAGHSAISRGGLSILTNIGLPELVAQSMENYLQIATQLASDLPRLAQLRATMRQRMQNSALMNGGKYVADLEAAYRTMWRTWCEKKQAVS